MFVLTDRAAGPPDTADVRLFVFTADWSLLSPTPPHQHLGLIQLKTFKKNSTAIEFTGTGLGPMELVDYMSYMT